MVNLSPSGDGFTFDKERVPIPEACKRLKEAGADVVGINCFAGPDTFIPLIKKIKQEVDVSAQETKTNRDTIGSEWCSGALSISKGTRSLECDLSGTCGVHSCAVQN